MGEFAWEGFSTLSVNRPQRVRRWNDFGSETLCHMTVDPGDRDCFDACLQRVECGPLGFVHMRSTAATARSGEGGVGGWAAVEQDSILVLVPEKGHSYFAQGNREFMLSPGDLLIRDLSKPWVHSCNDLLDFLMVKIPYSTLLPKVDDPGRLLGTTLPYDNAAAAMCADVIRGANRTLRSMDASRISGSISDLILDSVGMLYHATTEAEAWGAGSNRKSTLRRDAKNFIIRHLEDPDLSVASIATAMGIGQRRLQRAFMEVDEAPSRFILEQRLDHAARLLAERVADRTILDVALSSGFNDASHFSRAFAARFGMAPSKYAGSPPLPGSRVS